MIKRQPSHVHIYYGEKNEFFEYDKVVLASHADEALNIIEKPSEEEKKILQNFSYRSNLAVIHTDETVMPKNKNAWSSWNSIVSEGKDSKNSWKISKSKHLAPLDHWLSFLRVLE